MERILYGRLLEASYGNLMSEELPAPCLGSLVPSARASSPRMPLNALPDVRISIINRKFTIASYRAEPRRLVSRAAGVQMQADVLFKQPWSYSRSDGQVGWGLFYDYIILYYFIFLGGGRLVG